MLRGRSTNLTPSQNAEVMAAINEGSNLGLPLEDIDFDSNAPATPAEPAEEIVVTPIGGLNLDSSLDEILVSEGGFQNRPKDRGNYRPDGTLIGTNRGVTPNSLAEFKGVDPNTITEADIKAVTEDEARQIFKQLYFDKPKLNQLPVNLQEAVFDMQVNSGRNAVRILQKLAGMSKDKRDGYVGPETLKALQGVNITNEQYADARIEFYNNLVKSDPNQYGENLAGWIARANKYRN
jgi:lysozyme family protein